MSLPFFGETIEQGTKTCASVEQRTLSTNGIFERQCPFCRQDDSSKRLGRKEVNITKR